jgi:hypothetical protein
MEFSVRGTPITFTPLMIVAVLLGLGAVGYGGLDYIHQSDAVEDAVEINTTVTDTEIRKSVGRGLAYRVTVEHTYQYRGTEYTSERVFPGATSPVYTQRGDAENVAERYEPNTTVTAYVDPDSPGQAFLERQTTMAPFGYVGLGGIVAILTMLHAVGVRNPGQGTELQPASEHEPTRYDTLFGLDRGTVHSLSKRLMVIAPIGFLLSLVATVYFIVSGSSSIQADPTDPVGLALLTAGITALGLMTALVAYGVWSFTEYRRLRERISEPQPPSPFRHPTRLVTILYTSDGLDAYGRRVKLTAFVFVLIVFFAGLLMVIVPL